MVAFDLVSLQKRTNVRVGEGRPGGLANPADGPRQRQGLVQNLLHTVRPWSAVERAARSFLVPQRIVTPPALPEPPGGRILEMPDFTPHLNVHCWGPETAPAVLLVHGWERHLYDMMSFVPALLVRGRRVVAFDAPAHGRSSGEMATLVDLSRAIVAVGEASGGVAAAIGHSLGAAALVLAMAEGFDPGRAVLLAPPPAPLPYALASARRHRLDADQTSEMLSLLDAALGRPLAAISTAALAEGLRQPALLVHSLDDRVAPVSGSLHIASAWPGARIHLVEGLGHNRLLRDGDVVDLVAAFASASA